MSYQVLARKWRPKNFEELQGQEHVSRALINAIETERLHHAYLFTGTRGVGKTTIARILSKCLNCETHGLTAKPCGECASCVEIDEGRFVDLIEVDAASRTKVDDTRELLDNVQYRPTRGRYKVYLIDEVHMLSNSSFNALLKTLEEPPEHVIFLLATTDPQKLPVTVLSRCLQFHLKHMDEKIISKHLNFILEQEAIKFEPMALNLIAQSAEGSMRDALSLLDQAIAFGQGQVNEVDIRSMLGTIDHQFIERLLMALADKDSKMAIEAIDEMSNFPLDFADALKELLSRIHQTAIFQATGVLLDTSASYVEKFAQLIEPPDLQLYYQLGLHARRDLAWAATPKQGLEMALLRMLAFNIAPQDPANSSTSSPASHSSTPEGVKKKASLVAVEKPLTTEASVKKIVAKELGSSSDNAEEPPFDPDEYAWVEQASSPLQQQGPQEFKSKKAKSNQYIETPEPKVELKATINEATVNKTEKTGNADPVASLHAALGLQTDDRQPSKSVSFSKLIEDELEETTSQPKQIPIENEPVSNFIDTDEDLLNEQLIADNILVSQSDTITAENEYLEEKQEIESAVVELSADEDEWAHLIIALSLPGTFHQIAQSSLMNWLDNDRMAIRVSPSQDVICTDSAKAGIEKAIIEHFDRGIKFDWSFEEPTRETPAMIFQRKAKEKHQKACDLLEQHPFSKRLMQQFSAQLIRESVEYLD